MPLLDKIKQYSFQPEPYAGGNEPYEQQIVASLPFLKLIDPKLKKVLVIGCADGYEMKWLIDNGHETIGITKSEKEVEAVTKKYGLMAKLADMHELPFPDNSFDCIYASNVLEHSVAPFVALMEWRRVLKPGGQLILVMPSKVWMPEFYHFSVLTRGQIRDLLNKTGFKLQAGPGIKPQFVLNGGDIFHDLGRGRGHYDGFVATKGKLSKNQFMLGEEWQKVEQSEGKHPIVRIVKSLIKKPYNKARVLWARHHPEIW